MLAKATVSILSLYLQAVKITTNAAQSKKTEKTAEKGLHFQALFAKLIVVTLYC